MRRPTGDGGAYAILYGLLLLVVLGVAAIVVDLGSLRQDRRLSRLTADSAALNGARSLNANGVGNPQNACTGAWSYVGTNLDIAVASPTGCATFPTSYDATTETCPTATPYVATATSEGVTVTITWPVGDTSPLMNGNAQPADQATTVQAIDPQIDGTPCSRIAVTVVQSHEAAFASVFGTGTTRTAVSSVARATSVPGEGEDIAALNVLNETTCYAIDMDGQAALLINAVIDPDTGETKPGIISVESNGREAGDECPNSRKVVIHGPEAASTGFIRADGAGGAGTGIIYSYALNDSPKGNPDDAYNPDLVPPTGTKLRPKPTLLGARTGETPVTTFYECSGTCTTVPEDYIALLKSHFATGTPTAYPYADSPYNGSAFQTLPGTAVPSFPNNCTINAGARVVVPAGNWYLNCNTLTVKGTLVIKGGTVVTKGGIDVANGCFAMNVPTTTLPVACPTIVAGDVSTPPSTASILYMRGGNFTNSGTTSIFLPRTFVYMSSGHVDFGAQGIALYWTNPRVTDSTCESDECVSQRFAKVALWNRSTDTQVMGGQASLTLRGVLFMPDATFNYKGQSLQSQASAQFWADRLVMTGQGGLTMAPNPTDSFPTPALSTALIR